jgi:hypothetical protein
LMISWRAANANSAAVEKGLSIFSIENPF